MQIFDSRGQIKESVARFFRAKGSAPRLILEDVNADADERLWDWQASNGQLALRTRTDADESGASPIVISRQGTTVTAISLVAGALTFNGTPLVLQSRQIMAGTGLTGGGDLSADRTISLSASTISAVNLAMSAVQPGDLANVAFSGDYADLVNTPTIPPDLSALQFLTAVDESTALPNSRRLVAGSNITFDTSTPGQLTIHATGSGGGGAVNAVIGGTGISVDNTDPTEPVVSLSADSQAALALATTAVQPEDLALVAFSGEYSDLSGIPSTFAPSAHTHNASDINAGTLADERLSTNIPRLNATNTFSAVQTVQVSGVTPLSIQRVGSSQNVNIEFRHDGATRYFGIDASGNLRVGTSADLTVSGTKLVLDDDPRLSDARTPVAHTHLWADITDKPTTFAPSAHSHGDADITGLSWAKLSGVPVYATRWPSWDEVTGKPSSFTPSAHTHSAADITSGTLSDARLPTTMTGKRFSSVVIFEGAEDGSVFHQYRAAAALGITGTLDAWLETDGFGLTTSPIVRFRRSGTNPGLEGVVFTQFDTASTAIYLLPAQGLAVGNPTGGLMGAGSVNANALYQNGIAVSLSGHAHSATDITSGTLADARLSANIPRLNAANTFSAVQTVQVSGATPLSIRRVGSSQNVNIEFQHDGATRYLGLDSSGNLRFGDTSNLNSSGVRVSLEGHTHSGADITSGTIADARLSANIPRLNGTNFYTGNNNFLSDAAGEFWIARDGSGVQGLWFWSDAFGNHIESRSSLTNYKGMIFTATTDASGSAANGEPYFLFEGRGGTDWLRIGHDKITTYLPMEVSPGYFIRFRYWSQFNDDDGKIGAGLYEPGLNIIGAQTNPELPRHTRIFGSVYLHEGGRLYASDGTAYLKSNYTSGNVTISTSAPSGGNDGDIWLQVL